MYTKVKSRSHYRALQRMDYMLNVKLIIGSTREGRSADLVSPWVIRSLQARQDLTVEVLDLRDWDLPMFRETFATVGDSA
jgi:NAD(P)H-dependent FMN reductase